MPDNSEYWLVPSNEPGYYTREPDGISGMTVSALADFCGVDQPVITNLLNKVRDSDPILNDLEDCLKLYAGNDLRLISNDSQGRLIIIDEVCQAILEYYAFDARSYKGKDIAVNNFRVISKAGMRLFIWSKTGYVPPEFRQDKQAAKGSYWYKRLGLAMSNLEKPLQAGYFCVYLEMMRFFNELEVRLGYVVPDFNVDTFQYVIPDNSIGQCFNSWLRDEDKTISIELARKVRKQFLGSEEIVDFRDAANLKSGYRPAGKNNYELVKYNHVFPKESHPKKNIHPVNSYPNKYKSIFHYYLEEHYIPERCFAYIQERDPKGIEQIKQNLALMPDKTKFTLSKTLVGRFIQNLLPPSK